MNNDDALKFYKLNNNYKIEELKKVRHDYLKENSNINIDNLEQLKKSDTYYKLLLEKIVDSNELLKEAIFDFERKFVLFTKPNGKFNDLSEKYLIKLQYVKNMDELNNLEEDYFNDLKILLGLNKRNKKNNKVYLEKEKESFNSYLEDEYLNAKLKESREVINRYRGALKRINNLKNMLKLEENYKNENLAIEKDNENVLLEKRKYELQNELKMYINIPNNNMFSELDKYQDLIAKSSNLEELERIYGEFLKEYRNLFNKNKKYIQELKKALKKMLQERFKENGSLDIEFLNELCFKIDLLDDEKLYTMLPEIDKITFKEEDKEILKEFLPLIYIHRHNGDVVSVTRKDNKQVRFYSLKKHDYYSIPSERFEYNFLSLKSFMKHAEYVGNRNVWLLDNKGQKIGIKFPNQELIYYYDGIILSFEHNNDKDNFYFYPDANFKLNINAKWHYSETSDKMGVANDLFKNEDYTYQMIIENMQKRINSELENENSKRR